MTRSHLISTAVLAAALISAAGLPARAASSFSKDAAGTSAAQFLKLGVGARAIAMGEAATAVTNDATALFWNPAALASIDRFSVSLMHASLFQNVNYEFLGGAYNFPEIGVIGAGVQYLSPGSIDETDSSGFSTGSAMHPNDLAVTLSFAREYEGIKAGISGKYISSKLTNTATAFAADAGIISPGFFYNRARAAFTVQNLGSGLKYDQESDPLPLTFRTGVSYIITNDFVAETDLIWPRDNNPAIGAGAEYRIKYTQDMLFALRAGYNSRTAGNVDGFNGFSFGIGGRMGDAGLDYAFLPFGNLGSTHRISLTFGFGKNDEIKEAGKPAAKQQLRRAETVRQPQRQTKQQPTPKTRRATPQQSRTRQTNAPDNGAEFIR